MKFNYIHGAIFWRPLYSLPRLHSARMSIKSDEKIIFGGNVFSQNNQRVLVTPRESKGKFVK